MAENAKDVRARGWTIVVYPESAPENWIDIINEEHVAWFCSPLHNLDTNPDGEVKKAHWHIVLTFDGKKSYTQIKEIADKINAPIPQRVASIRGAVRYLTHMDNPEKYQYKQSDIRCFGGADIQEFLAPTMSEKKELLKEITRYIRDNHVIEFSDFMVYCAEEREDWFDIITSSFTLYTNSLIRSERHKM